MTHLINPSNLRPLQVIPILATDLAIDPGIFSPHFSTGMPALGLLFIPIVHYTSTIHGEVHYPEPKWRTSLVSACRRFNHHPYAADHLDEATPKVHRDTKRLR